MRRGEKANAYCASDRQMVHVQMRDSLFSHLGRGTPVFNEQ